MKIISASIIFAAIATAGAILLVAQSAEPPEDNATGVALQALSPNAGELFPGELPQDGLYIPSTPDNVQWGSLPNRDAQPILSVASGAIVTFDTVSHEGS